MRVKEDSEAMRESRRRRPGRANNEHQEKTVLGAMTSTRRRQEQGPGVGHDYHNECVRKGPLAHRNKQEDMLGNVQH